MKILVTGGSGFLGRGIVNSLKKDHHDLVMTSRRDITPLEEGVEVVNAGELNDSTDFSTAMGGVGVVIHTAARVHMMADDSPNPLREFRSVNVDGTLNLAKQAANHGVKRFIYISSIKVNGEETSVGKPYVEKITHVPVDPYALSKYEAERGLLAIMKESGMEVVIIRPPLIYGPGVGANFESMISILNRGMLLPLGAIKNKRSLISIYNLIDFIRVCISHPNAGGQVFLVSDGHDVSTTELLRTILRALGKRNTLVPIPHNLVVFVSTALGKKSLVERLCGSLVIDISKSRKLLGWEPKYSFEDEIKKTVREFLNYE